MENKKVQENKKPYYQTWMTVIYDKQLKVAEIINPQHCMLLQLAAEDFIGQSVEDLEKITSGPNKEAAHSIAKNVRLAVIEKRNVYFEYTTTHKDNSVTYSICYAEHGNDGLLYVNVIKIDEENLFEARDGFTNYVINTTMNNVSVGVYMRHIKDDDTRTYLLFNDVAKQMYEDKDVLKSKYWNQHDEDMADERTLQLRDPLKIEKVVRDDDGYIKSWWVITKKKITSRAKGYYIITTTIDITQRRQNEILLEQQYSILDTMYEHLPVGIVVYDKNGKLISINKKDLELFGVKDKECVKDTNLFDEPNTPEHIKNRVRAGENFEYTLDYDFDKSANNYIPTDKKGRRTLLVKLVTMHDKNNEINGFLQICEDITERQNTADEIAKKNAELELSQKNMMMTVEAGNIATWIFNINTRNIEITHGTELHKEKIVALKDFEQCLYPDSLEILDKVVNNVLTGQRQSGNMELKSKNESGDDVYYIIYYRTTVNAAGEVDGVLGTIKDVSDSRKRQQLLEDYREQTNMIISACNIVQWSYDVNTKTISTQNDNAISPNKPFTKEEYFAHLHPDDVENVKKSFVKFDNRGTEFTELTVRIQLPNVVGYRTVKLNCVPMRDSNGEIYKYIGLRRDVTKETEINKELKQLKSEADYTLSLLARTIDKLPMGFFTKDVDSRRYLRANSILNDIFGNSEVSLIGKTDYDVHHKYLADLFNDADNKTIKAGGEQVTSLLKVNDGDKFKIVETVEALIELPGNRRVIVGVVNDVTQREIAKEDMKIAKADVEKSLSLITNTIDKLPMGFFIKDVDTRKYIRVNDRLGELFNKPCMNAVGMTDYELHSKEIADDFKVGNDMAIAANGEQVLTNVSCEIDGRINIIETVEAMITLNDGQRLIVGASNDVTKRETIKKELNDAKERAEQSDKLKSAFLANMSHEIRTPLNAIVGFSELMIDSKSHEERIEYAHVISQNNELLLRLINDILDLSKVEAGMTDLKPERYDMSGFFNDITTSLRQRVVNPDVQYIVENPYCTCMVTFDRNRMAQVITNYVTNAIKYTPSGSIRVGYKQENDKIKIYVTDTGIGISDDKKDKVFKRFEKLDEFAQGSGLGLSIVKALSEVCGGNVGFESEFGKGSTFWAVLPCGDIEIADTMNVQDIVAEELISSNTKKESEIRILVAEDNDSNYLLVSTILKDFDLVHVVNGKLAVEAALNEYFDVVLMDMKMPLMNGLEASKIIHDNKADLPIIAVTANAFDSDREAALSAGCIKFITKPIKRQILIDAIKSVLK